jgi:hypothetical protein
MMVQNTDLSSNPMSGEPSGKSQLEELLPVAV